MTVSIGQGRLARKRKDTEKYLAFFWLISFAVRNAVAAVVNQPITHTSAASLMSPWMSLVLHSLSRQHRDHRLDPNVYRLAISSPKAMILASSNSETPTNTLDEVVVGIGLLLHQFQLHFSCQW